MISSEATNRFVIKIVKRSGAKEELIGAFPFVICVSTSGPESSQSTKSLGPGAVVTPEYVRSQKELTVWILARLP